MSELKSRLYRQLSDERAKHKTELSNIVVAKDAQAKILAIKEGRNKHLTELETAFCKLQSLGVPASEHIGEQKFADRLRKIEAPISENLLFPCMCSF